MAATEKLKNNPFFFVHVPRTAGTSVAISLSYKHYGDQHRTAAEIQHIVGMDNWSSKFSFAFVRNPWDRAVSWYTNSVGRGLPDDMSFRTWVKEGMRTHWDNKTDAFGNPLKFFNMGSWLSNVKLVYRFEDLQEAWDDICYRTKIVAELKHFNVTGHKYYKQMYDEKTMKMVADICATDIEKYNYSF